MPILSSAYVHVPITEQAAPDTRCLSCRKVCGGICCSDCAKILYPDWEISFIASKRHHREGHPESYQAARLVNGEWIHLKSRKKS